MPDRESIEIKPGFRERYSALTDWEPFIDFSLSFLQRSIRVNTLKTTVGRARRRLSSDWELEPIPWCPEGFWVKSERRDIGNTTLHALGHIYVQEAVSMIPPIVLDPRPGEHVLDLCASPGSKTTQIAAMMRNEGALVANDMTGARMKPLGLNLQRCGVSNAIITMMEGQWFTGKSFDRVLVDAPCSGTGTIRKSLKTLRMWNPGMTKRLSAVQKRLLLTAYDNLRPGGVAVYSTCTLEPEEDEAVLDHLLREREGASLEPIGLPLRRGDPVLSFAGREYDPRIKDALRLWPQDNDTEGFFVARIRKPE
ncbi:RsmB/NOP family class I SAM-dependent RNA methyltransferase [Candidatus Woesearchaeota archaeon]|nr:RsmB/NOP family class I SAM-dependent RNA methyltransferase [Candidatus Woesearchaeota archaeon]